MAAGPEQGQENDGGKRMFPYVCLDAKSAQEFQAEMYTRNLRSAVHEPHLSEQARKTKVVDTMLAEAEALFIQHTHPDISGILDAVLSMYGSSPQISEALRVGFVFANSLLHIGSLGRDDQVLPGVHPDTHPDGSTTYRKTGALSELASNIPPVFMGLFEQPKLADTNLDKCMRTVYSFRKADFGKSWDLVALMRGAHYVSLTYATLAENNPRFRNGGA